MQLFTGSPLALKKHFLKNLQELKINPLERVLVLIPSKHLETRLKKELCQKILCLAGVNFMPLSALAREINQTAPTPPPPLADDSPLLDFKIKHLLKEHHFNSNRELAICFKNSFRDLINAEVTPDTLISIIDDEELFLDEQRDYLKQFVSLYSSFLDLQKEPNKSTYKDYFIAARNNTENNPFLDSFKHIIFYGFYDFTSLHYELISAVINNYKEKTQVYLPYEKHPAYTFTEPSFNTLFLHLSDEHIHLESETNNIKTTAENIFTPEQTPVKNADITMIKVSGEGEVQAAAKKILELHKNGIPYEDIALTFRSERGFSNKILEVFKQNQIPINYNFSFPLLQKPFAAFVYNLFNLEKNNFAREEVSAVLNAPFCAFRKDNWTNLIQQSGVECAITQFEEMLPNDKENAKQSLIDTLKEIKAHLSYFNKAGNFEKLAQQAKSFLLKFTSVKAQQEQEGILTEIKKILDIIASYSITGKEAQEGEFLEEFFALLKEATFNKVSQAPNAVEIADIMTLRLQDFKAVILIGLNEGLFPLMPEQDPALKEVYRQSLKKLLRHTLKKIGYLIHTRQDRYFEENFLFYLALSAAQNKAILTYKTSDEEGKHLVKSIFITLLLTVLSKKEDELETLSRRPFERLKNDIIPEFLTREEAANLTALTNPDNKDILANLISKEEDISFFEQEYLSLKALSSIGALTNFDGIINKDTAKKIKTLYSSPTALSNLFSCPMKYFINRLIKQEDKKFSRGKLSDKDSGNLYHYILFDFYNSIKNKLQTISCDEIENLFLNFIEKYFKSANQTKYGLYPLLWEVIKKEIIDDLLSLIKKDLINMQKTNFFPVYFEKEEYGTLPLSNGELAIKARIDRIDLKPNSSEGIAIDYKSTYKSNIWKLIFEESRLQPPIYLEILNKQNSEKVFTSANFYFIKNKPKEKMPVQTLTLNDFNKKHKKFTDLFVLLNELISDGIFPIVPDKENSCKYCNYKDICRKNHLQTLRRAKKSNFYKQLRKFHYDFEG